MKHKIGEFVSVVAQAGNNATNNHAHIPRPGPTPPLAQQRPSPVVQQRQSPVVQQRQGPGIQQRVGGQQRPSPVVQQRASPSVPIQKVIVPQKKVMPTKIVTQQNGRQSTGRLSFPDCKIRDLPFFPVKSTLLRPCNLTAKDSSMVS